MVDLTHITKHLVQTHLGAEATRLVLDNISTHKTVSNYEAFPLDKARAISDKLAFDYISKHGRSTHVPEMEFALLAVLTKPTDVPMKKPSDICINTNVCEHNAKHQPNHWCTGIHYARRKPKDALIYSQSIDRK
jgi:hypothetical protein